MKHLQTKWNMIGAGVALGLVASATPSQAQLLGVSEREEIAAGREVVQQAIREYGRPLSASDPRQRRVSAIAARMLPYVKRKNIPYSFTVLNNDKVLNAFAAPGGPVMVTTKLLDTAANDAELAFVIGHEIGHIEEKHAVNSAQRQSQVGLAAGILGAVLGRRGGSDLVGTLAGVGLSLWQSGYSRGQERESDEFGVRIMSQAGFDPRAGVSMLGKLSGGGSGLTKYLATHPGARERQQRVQTQIQKENLVTTARSKGLLTNLSGTGGYAPSISSGVNDGDVYPSSRNSRTEARRSSDYVALRVEQSGSYRTVLAPVAQINDFAGGRMSYRNGQLSVARGNSSATFAHGSRTAIVNGRRTTMSASAKIIDGVFYAPLGTIATGLDGSATYDARQSEIRLDFGTGRTATLALTLR